MDRDRLRQTHTHLYPGPGGLDVSMTEDRLRVRGSGGKKSEGARDVYPDTLCAPKTRGGRVRSYPGPLLVPGILFFGQTLSSPGRDTTIVSFPAPSVESSLVSSYKLLRTQCKFFPRVFLNVLSTGNLLKKNLNFKIVK